MTRITRTRFGAFAAVAVAIAAAVGAYAYWTAGGSGTGSASAAGAQAALTVTQTTTLAAMYPGDSPQTITGSITNTNDGPIRVNAVTVSISGVTKAVGAPAGDCDATDFTLADAAMAVNAEMAKGTTADAFTGATIQFNNKASTNQNGCKGATVNLAYAIS